MGYFSGLLISKMERQEQLFGGDSVADDSYPSPVLQMRWRLEELTDCLKDFLFWHNLASFQQGRPLRSWKTVYKEWPEYWSDRHTDLLYYPTSYFTQKSENPIEELLIAIASVQKKLFFYGCNADAEAAEKERRSLLSFILEGQLPLQSAA